MKRVGDSTTYLITCLSFPCLSLLFFPYFFARTNTQKKERVREYNKTRKVEGKEYILFPFFSYSLFFFFSLLPGARTAQRGQQPPTTKWQQEGESKRIGRKKKLF